MQPIKLDAYYLYPPPFEGGFCKVYKAVRPDIPGKFFAIKMPKENKVSQKKVLQREVKFLSKIQHPNIVKLYENHLDKNPPYIVEEYVEGGDLRAQVGKLSYKQVLFILYRISQALGFIHQSGGFHRDIKPDNILVTKGGDLKLGDPNIANVPSTTTTMTRSIGGTPGYIDPWVANNQYDSIADIYSLGVTVVELLTDKRPVGFSLTQTALPISNIIHRRAFYRLIAAMISKDRNLRPNAYTIEQYTLALLDGGPLPTLPMRKKIQPKPTESPSIVGVLVTSAVLVLVFVGIAALLSKSR